jgi:hypothetical protein
MKLLLDENIAKRLKEDIADHEFQNNEYQILTAHLYSFISYS